MNEKLRRLWPTLLVPLIFTAVTIAQFWPAITGAASLSKVQQLAEWDSLFAAQRTGHSMLMDPSLVYLMVPGYLLKAGLIHSGQWPLWNPYSGLGCPLAADPQSLAFSPLHIPLLLSPGLVAYNQVLVLEILVLGLSTFALARSLRLGLFASAFAMVAMAFCPYERWYLELLGNGFCFVPVAFWLILGLRLKVTAGKIWCAGLGCAAMVLSAHPEMTFFSIGLASLALFLYVLFDRGDLAEVARNPNINASTNPNNESVKSENNETAKSKNSETAKPQINSEAYKNRLCHAGFGLVAAGVLAFMLAAPMLLPFLEYLRNSDSYKFGSGAPAIVPWQTWLFNLLQPGYAGASPTLGPSALLLIPLAFSAPKGDKTLIAVLAALAVFCLALTSKIFPLNLLLAHPPFSYIVVNYAFPALILLTAILAAFGLQTALDAAAPGRGSADLAASTNKSENEENPRIGLWPLGLSLSIALLVVAFPLAARGLHLPLNSADFDLCMPDYAFNRNDVVRYGAFALLTGAALLAIKLKPIRKTGLFLIAAICLGQSAEIITAAKSMPYRSPFKYQEETLVPKLKELTCMGTNRFVATGNHLLRPNTNVVFGLSDLRTHNPLFPKRYIAYLKACGANLDDFNQVFENPLSPLLSLGSVSAVLSQGPVLSKQDLSLNEHTENRALTIEPVPGIRATFTPAILDKQKRAIFGRLALAAAPKKAEALSYNLALYDLFGHVLWFSDPRPLAGDLTATQFVAIPTPKAQPGKGFLIGLQIFDNISKHWLSPKAQRDHNSGLKDVFVLGSIDLDSAPNIDAPDYRPAFESAARLRIYENMHALPRAYAVHQSITVADVNASLAAIQAKSFDPGKTVVIERPAIRNASDKPSGGTGGHSATLKEIDDTVSIAELGSNMVVINAHLKAPGTVVLNDIFYPGWQATEDGKPVPILRANYLMRGVEVPAGKHLIVFNYFPGTFTAGLVLAIAALLIGMLIAVRVLTRMGTISNKAGHWPVE